MPSGGKPQGYCFEAFRDNLGKNEVLAMNEINAWKTGAGAKAELSGTDGKYKYYCLQTDARKSKKDGSGLTPCVSPDYETCDDAGVSPPNTYETGKCMSG